MSAEGSPEPPSISKFRAVFKKPAAAEAAGAAKKPAAGAAKKPAAAKRPASAIDDAVHGPIDVLVHDPIDVPVPAAVAAPHALPNADSLVPHHLTLLYSIDRLNDILQIYNPNAVGAPDHATLM